MTGMKMFANLDCMIWAYRMSDDSEVEIGFVVYHAEYVFRTKLLEVIFGTKAKPLLLLVPA
jgi:hypothetical protein